LQSIASDDSISSNPSYGGNVLAVSHLMKSLVQGKMSFGVEHIKRTLQRIMSSSRKQMLDAESRMYFH
jgi:hypothetical protein